MVVALIALFVSFAGNAAAVTYFVTSKQIKDGSIQLRDMSPAARAALRGSQGPQGPQGPRGYTGSQGPRGYAGTPGESYDPFPIKRDFKALCVGLGKAQNEIDDLNSTVGRYSAYWPYPGDFRLDLCSYYDY